MGFEPTTPTLATWELSHSSERQRIPETATELQHRGRLGAFCPIDRISGMACDWMGVGTEWRSSASADRIGAARPSSSKDFMKSFVERRQICRPAVWREDPAWPGAHN